ncbi:MAG: LemA protein [Frankiales bacterium]|nr:LemA protein [Frankiales bacterium]
MIAVVAAVLIIAIVVGFNALVRRRNRCDASWAQVDVQLVKRHDLIPNVVEAVKGYAAHERQSLQAVTEARSSAMSAQGPAARAGAEDHLTAALGGLFVVAENYPALKASDNFLDLQGQLASVEAGIAYARQYYNDAVLSYLNTRSTFPLLLVAHALRFGPREYFRAGAGTTEPVEVSLS